MVWETRQVREEVDYCSPSFTSLSPPPYDDANMLRPIVASPLRTATHANVPSRSNYTTHPSPSPASQSLTANDASANPRCIATIPVLNVPACHYPPPPRHAPLPTNNNDEPGTSDLTPPSPLPTLRHAHSATAPCYPPLLSHAHQHRHSRQREFFCMHCDVATACKRTLRVRFSYGGPLGSTANETRGLICAYERAECGPRTCEGICPGVLRTWTRGVPMRAKRNECVWPTADVESPTRMSQTQ